MVFLHGLADDSTVWAGSVAALAADHACIAVDLPGHGRSPTPDDPCCYRRPAVLEAIDAVLDSIGPVALPVVLVGHSLGSYLALAYQITRPGRLGGMVLVAAGPGFRDRRSMDRWNERVEASAASLPIARVASTISFHDDSLVIDRLDEVTVPVALVVGADDKGYLGANDYLERRLVDVRRYDVPEGRHRVMLTHPEVVASALREIEAVVAAGVDTRSGS